MLRELHLEERGGRAEASGGVVVVQADRKGGLDQGGRGGQLQDVSG